jgi:tetratricopeptide (TPR) repeat protein
VEGRCKVRASSFRASRGHVISRPTLKCAEMLCFCFLAILLTSPVGAGQTSSQLSHTQQLYQEGMSLVRQGKLDEALQAFNRGLESDPSNLVLLNAIGATYTLKGDPEKAQDCFQKVLKIDPGFLPARKNLAMAYFNCGKYDLAGQEFDQLTASPDAGPLAHLFLGMIAEKRKQYETAIWQLKQAGELVFHNSAAILSFARSLYEEHQPEKSELALQRLAGIAGVRAADYYEAGLLYSKCGLNDQALEALTKAHQMDAELPGLEYRLALILDKMNRAAEAFEVLQKLVAQKPDQGAFELLGDIARREGKIEIAAETFRKLIDIEPDHEEPYLSLSTLLMDNENDPLGLKVVEAGLAHIPQSYRLQVQKGAILEDLDRHQEAQDAFRSAMKLQADHRDALIGLAVSQVYGSEIPEGVETLAAGVK